VPKSLREYYLDRGEIRVKVKKETYPGILPVYRFTAYISEKVSYSGERMKFHSSVKAKNFDIARKKIRKKIDKDYYHN